MSGDNYSDLANYYQFEKIKLKGYSHLFRNDFTEHDTLKLTKLIHHWPMFDNLQVIVVGSSNKEGFVSSGAFVGQLQDNEQMPTSVENLNRALNYRFYRGSSEDQIGFDPQAVHSKYDHGILFINVCLDSNNEDLDTAILTTHFINRILKDKHEQSNRIFVLDMRLDMHAHISEESYANNDLRQDDFGFKISQEYHYVLRLEHPGYLQYDPRYYFTDIHGLPTEIASIYRNKSSCKACNPFH